MDTAVNHVRYWLAVMTVITLPPGLLFWFVIHPWARQWRKLGPRRTYLIVLPALAALGTLLFQVRRQLVGADLGMHYSLIAIAGVIYCVTFWLEFRYWKHLNIAIAAGVHELSPAGAQKGKLLRQGVYGTIRHPRYLSAGLGVIANALIMNYVGVYLLILVLYPVGFVMLLFEERELLDRFGEEYRQYQAEVPRFLPRLRQRPKGH